MSGSIAPTSGHSPFVRASLPPPASFHSFPSTSFSTPSSTNPYVTDPGYGRRTPITNSQDEPSSPQKQSEARGQTLEEMYSAPENTLEIEVREPRTQGELQLRVWARLAVWAGARDGSELTGRWRRYRPRAHDRVTRPSRLLARGRRGGCFCSRQVFLVLQHEPLILASAASTAAGRFDAVMGGPKASRDSTRMRSTSSQYLSECRTSRVHGATVSD